MSRYLRVNQHLLKLRRRLDDVMEMVVSALSDDQGRYKHHFGKKAKQRDLVAGDKVPTLLPSDNNTLLVQWRGPFTVEEKVRLNIVSSKLKAKEEHTALLCLLKYYERK